MTLHLLDVNALLALHWEEHQFHDPMASWFSSHESTGWATCAITQAGYVRVMNLPALARHGRTLAELADVLAQNAA